MNDFTEPEHVVPPGDSTRDNEEPDDPESRGRNFGNNDASASAKVHLISNRNTFQRLLCYRTALIRLRTLGFNVVYSDFLANTVGMNSTILRKDFSLLKIRGRKRGGYPIEELLVQIDEVIGKTGDCAVIIVGAGNLGSALMTYKGFANDGFLVVAAFDIDPSKQNQRLGIPVYPLEKMDEIIQTHRVTLGILCVPEIAAQQVFDKMVIAGIKSVLNFSPCILQHDQQKVLVSNVNLSHELHSLAYFAEHQFNPPPGKARGPEAGQI